MEIISWRFRLPLTFQRTSRLTPCGRNSQKSAQWHHGFSLSIPGSRWSFATARSFSKRKRSPPNKALAARTQHQSARPSTSRLAQRVIPLLLAVVILAVYSPVSGFDFINLDDAEY